ncbi:hypothetical protein BKI52_06710 [marine bacterium AO1-C]|nr:hypothetical protein BKI52_06710 [marine bacterium AO1-C]
MKLSKKRLLIILLVSGILTVLALLSASQTVLMRSMRDRPGNFWEMARYEIIIWQVWGLFVPFIFWASKKYPLERRVMFRNLLFHIPVSVAVVLIYFTIYIAYDRAFFSFYTHPKWSFWQCMLIYIASKFHWNFITYWGILGVMNTFEYQRKFKERELRAIQLESQLFQSQLQALKMQLHPHFLFNTLHTIASMVRQEEKKEAVEMLTGLSELLRMALEQGQKQKISLKEEMDFVNTYLAIEQVRFKDRLQLDIVIAANTLDALVPSLLLQPLVENAVKHGLAKKLSAKVLKIQTKQTEGQLRIQIFNEGYALADDWQIQNVSGLGIKNTYQRLKQLYPGEYELSFKNHENGVLANICIPLEIKS